MFGAKEADVVVKMSTRQRQTMNIVGVHASFYGPWLLFCLVFAALSFECRYRYEFAMQLFTLAAFFVVCCCGMLAYFVVRAKQNGARWEPTWYVFLFVTMFLAWLLAIVQGNSNFYGYMQPYHDVQNLGTYVAVDPSRMRGQQLMDAGHVRFVPGARVDTSKAQSFRNLDDFCVAPITVSSYPLSAYDFWAVGVNCCDDNGNFHCGAVDKPNAVDGLRVVNDAQRPFFRLAVEQAESTYNIRANHPLFFTWTEDSHHAVDMFRLAGFKFYLKSIFGYFVFQLVLVLVAAYVQGKSIARF